MQANMVEDEMDKLINLKAARFANAIMGTGFFLSLFSLVFNFSPAVMLNILFLSCFVAAITEGSLSIYYYKKGIRNG